MADNWDVEVVKVNFAMGGDITKQIQEKLRPVIRGIKGEVKQLIYTNPQDIQRAIIFVLYTGTYDAPTNNPNLVEKGGVKAEIIKGA